MENGSNMMATVALVAGIGAWVLSFVMTCLGFIPFLGILNIFLLPVVWICDLVAIITGFLGRGAAASTGVGGGAATAGLVLGGAHILMQIVTFAAIFALGGLAVVASLLSNM